MVPVVFLLLPITVCLRSGREELSGTVCGYGAALAPAPLLLLQSGFRRRGWRRCEAVPAMSGLRRSRRCRGYLNEQTPSTRTHLGQGGCYRCNYVDARLLLAAVAPEMGIAVRHAQTRPAAHG